MSELDSSLEWPEEEALLVRFNTGNLQEDEDATRLFYSTPVGEWASTRAGRFAEIVQPAVMYIMRPGLPNMHTVAWVRHVGLVETDRLRVHQTHHVVCDCVAEADTAGTPDSFGGCEDLEIVLRQRADSVGREFRAPAILGEYTALDTAEMQFRLTPLGEEIVMRSIAYVLESDRVHPENWMANRVRGMHEIPMLAAMLHEESDQVETLVDEMADSGLILRDGDIIRLRGLAA